MTDFECEEGETYVKIEFIIEREDDGNIIDCYFEEKTDTGLVDVTYWENKDGEECESIYVEWEADGYVASKGMAFGGDDCNTATDPGGS